MSAPTPTTPTAGCSRRRAKAIARRNHVTELTHAREDAAFFEHGTIPTSAIRVSMCPCGATAFSRGVDDWESERDWDDAHSYCDDVYAEYAEDEA